ncbi:universal stress protein [Nocardia sp. NPDC050793]|uniref:universal stress protein n=1 Tax=Nocardia sp. NPDC050793 TaxID=3155159 RepID=UPI00340C92D1
MVTAPIDQSHRLDPGAIVVGVDGSEAGDLALRWAAETASARGRRLRIVRALDLAAARAVFGSYDLLIPSVTGELREQGAHDIARARRLAQHIDPTLRIDSEISDRGAAAVLIDESETAHLTVIGAAGSGTTLGHLGSTLLAVTAHAHGSVVVVRDTGTEQQTRRDGPVVVGIDGSGFGRAALEAAFGEAGERHAQLIAVHCWTDLRFERLTGLPDTITDRDVAEAAQDFLTEQLTEWTQKYPEVPVLRKVYLSGPRHHLLEWSKSAQLVVTGSRGRGGFRGLLLGSTSNALVQRAHCPIMVVHPS